jgi:hypothetical protein
MENNIDNRIKNNNLSEKMYRKSIFDLKYNKLNIYIINNVKIP